ncbi:hypothetical protein WA588_003941, partial [Blastocystis sp. NMH]
SHSSQEAIEAIINHQKERYNEQLKQLYDFVNEYRRLSGINPITGQKSLSFRSLSRRENAFLEKASRDPEYYPITFFEGELLQCINKESGCVSTTENAEQFLELMRRQIGVEGSYGMQHRRGNDISYWSAYNASNYLRSGSTSILMVCCRFYSST